MKRRRPTTFLVMLLTGVLAGAVEAQELFYLKSSLDSQANAAGGSARELLDELLAQPAETRNAVLEAAQYPELLVRLKYLDTSTPEARDKLLAEYPPSAAEAARVLLANPPLLKKVGDRIVAAGLLGQMYARERDAVRQMADQIGQKRAEQSAASASAWEERLATDAAASAQLRQAVDAYTASGGVVVIRPAGSPASRFPFAAQVAFILAHADEYSELAAQIVDQWERERNPVDFRRAVDFWYAQHRQVLPNDLLRSPAEMAKLLKEHAVFERRYLETAAIAGPSQPDRLTYLEANLQQYPTLAEVRQEKIFAEARAKQSKIMGGPYTGSGKSGGTSSGGGSSSSGDTSMRSSRSNSMRASSNRSGSRNNSRNDNNSGRFGDSGGFNDSGFGGGGFGNDGGFGNRGGSGNNSGLGGSRSGGSGSRFGGSNSSFGSGGSQSGGSRFGSRQSGSRFGGSNNSSSNNNR